MELQVERVGIRFAGQALPQILSLLIVERMAVIEIDRARAVRAPLS